MRLINFSDGIATEDTQKKLQELLYKITPEELDNVEIRMKNLLNNIGNSKGKNYKVEFIPNVLLQIILHNNSPILQYGAHTPFHITINNMGSDNKNINPLKARIAKDIILTHEIGHAMMGDYNQIMDKKYNTRLMEKSTDEVIKSKIFNEFPNFYEMYRLCRNTHHYKTKEGDFKEFFKDIIEILEKEWRDYLEKELTNNPYIKGY